MILRIINKIATLPISVVKDAEELTITMRGTVVVTSME
jgi:hypothetical protein